MTIETITTHESTLLSKEAFFEVKKIWKELSKSKKAEIHHHVFYFLLTSHDPEATFKKAFSPLVNKNKLNNVNGDAYHTVKSVLNEMLEKRMKLKFIQPWLKTLLQEDEYQIRSGWGSYLETESVLIKQLQEKARFVLKSL